MYFASLDVSQAGRLNIDGTYRWPRPSRRRYFNNKLLHPVLVYLVHSIVALQLPAAERSCSVLFLFLSWRCPVAICMKLETPPVGRPVDLSLEWKSRIETFSSARAEALFYVFRDAVLSRLPPIDTDPCCILEYVPCTGPKNIGFAPPPASEISANLMRRTGIFSTLPITPLIRSYPPYPGANIGNVGGLETFRSRSFPISSSRIVQPNLISKDIFRGNRDSKVNSL